MSSPQTSAKDCAEPQLVHWCREACPLCLWMAELSPGKITVCSLR